MRFNRVVARILSGLLFALVPSPALAQSPVPYLANTEERQYVQVGYFLADGTPARITEAEEIVLCIQGASTLQDEFNYVIPQIVEIRRNIPGATFEEMPLIRIVWDAKGQGTATHGAIVMEYRNGAPTFLSVPLRSQDRIPMGDLVWFPSPRIRLYPS